MICYQLRFHNFFARLVFSENILRFLQVATLVNLASNYLNGGGQDAKRYGTAHASIVPYQSFETLDGYYTIGNNVLIDQV